jgi:hypothetical protein
VRWFSADVFFFEDDFSVARVEQSGDIETPVSASIAP